MKNYTKTKNTLDMLYKDLQSQYLSALDDGHNEHYKAASKKIALALGQANGELLLAEKELVVPITELDQERKSREEVIEVRNNIADLLEKMKATKNSYDQKESTNKVLDEIQVAQKRMKVIKEKQAIEQQFDHSYKQLIALTQQEEPFKGVEAELNSFLNKILELKQDNSVSTEDLTKAMNAAYDRLTGGSKEKFDDFTKKLHRQHSIPLKILGTTLIVLGAALIFSAILFAPAIITAAGTGLAAIYFASAGAAVASTALSVGGAACFFSKTNRMELAEQEHNLGDKNLEENHYQHLVPA